MSGTWPRVIEDVADRAFRGWIDPNEATRLIREIEDRDQFGRERYGVQLAPLNGRDQLQDAFEEALDGTGYAKSLCLELDQLGGDETFRREAQMFYEDFLALLGRGLRLKMIRERNPE
jgi:hypothetical protein